MASPSTFTAEVRASDSLQAAYFRGALGDHRATVTALIARQHRQLASMSSKKSSLAVSRLRRQIRESEAECRHLDHMIEAIDRRFSSQWASRP